MPNFTQFTKALGQAENLANSQNRPFYVISQLHSYRVSCENHPSIVNFKTLQVVPNLN